MKLTHTNESGHASMVDVTEKPGTDRVATAGASIRLKPETLALIAEGKADIYPRFGPTNEWDTAAGQGVLEAAGGEVVTTDGRPLAYGKPGFGNPHFIARSKAAR